MVLLIAETVDKKMNFHKKALASHTVPDYNARRLFGRIASQ